MSRQCRSRSPTQNVQSDLDLHCLLKQLNPFPDDEFQTLPN